MELQEVSVVDFVLSDGIVRTMLRNENTEIPVRNASCNQDIGQFMSPIFFTELRIHAKLIYWEEIYSFSSNPGRLSRWQSRLPRALTACPVGNPKFLEP